MSEYRALGLIVSSVALCFFIIGAFLSLFGCTDTLCPLYRKVDAIVEGYHTNKLSCYVSRVGSYTDCFTMTVDYSFVSSSGERLNCSVTGSDTHLTNDFIVNQTKQIWIHRGNPTCGLSNLAESNGAAGFIMVVIGLSFLVVAIGILAYDCYKQRALAAELEQESKAINVVVTLPKKLRSQRDISARQARSTVTFTQNGL